MFTARYGLSPYITLLRFVLKGLKIAGGLLGTSRFSFRRLFNFTSNSLLFTFPFSCMSVSEFSRRSSLNSKNKMHLHRLIWHWWMSLFTLQSNGQFIHSFIKRYGSLKFCGSGIGNFMHRQSVRFFWLMKLPLQNSRERNFVGISFALLVISRVCCVSGWPLVLCFGLTLPPPPPSNWSW